MPCFTPDAAPVMGLRRGHQTPQVTSPATQNTQTPSHRSRPGKFPETEVINHPTRIASTRKVPIAQTAFCRTLDPLRKARQGTQEYRAKGTTPGAGTPGSSAAPAFSTGAHSLRKQRQLHNPALQRCTHSLRIVPGRAIRGHRHLRSRHGPRPSRAIYAR